MIRGVRLAAIAVLALASITAAQEPEGRRVPPEPASAEPQVEFLFENPAGHPVVRLDAAAIDSIGTFISQQNLEVIAAVDSIYRAGGYGEPGSKGAREDALAAFVFAASTAFDFFLGMAMQDEVIYVTSEDDLRPAFTERLRNPGLYPIINLEEVRAGFGRFCLRFQVDAPEKREIEISGEKMKAWTEGIVIDGVERRVVNIDMKTLSHDRVHVVYERYSGATIEIHETEMRGQPVRVVTMDGISGQYVRKFGFHRPAAVVMWRALPGPLRAPPRDLRFVGTAIWFPALTLDLPWFLPNIGFHDLRQFDFPEPVLTIDAVEGLRDEPLDWLSIRDNSRIHGWEGDSEVPDFVLDRYPDF